MTLHAFIYWFVIPTVFVIVVGGGAIYLSRPPKL